MSEFEVVDIPNGRRSYVRPYDTFYQRLYDAIKSSAPGKAIRVRPGEVPESLLYEGKFHQNSWTEIKTNLDRRANRDGLWVNRRSPFRHFWGVERGYLEIWIEKKM